VAPGTLPIHPLDLEPFRLGDAADRRLVAARLDAACRDSGFLLVNGHDIAPELCDAVLDAFGGFFDLPLEEKRRVVVADEAADRGYSELGKEALAYSRGDATPPDLFEAFNVGREDAVGPYFDRHRAFFAPNVWPDRPRGLRDMWLEYDRHVSEVSDVLLRTMAIALALPEMWFVERCRHAIVTYRAIHYERAPSMAAPEPGQMRMGAHTDYGILTLLLADDVPGLQIFRNGVWHDVDVPRGSFVCNIGDMLERWTNERWTSTLHRVTPPSTDRNEAMTRRSIARFLDCEPDRVVKCIPSCTGAGKPARYGPVVAGDWLQAKVLGGRSRALAELPGGTT
jgi:isopenicillin N synthase-like dioxygenase